ncbi:MAG: adenosine kinase [Pseudomonadota bacterium]
MSKSNVALLGISNAIVDVLCHVQPQLLESLGAPPGSMTLIDQQQAEAIYAQMGPATESAGGSVANSVACFASLGGAAAYIGRVADDQLGNIFEHDMSSLGAEMRLPPETRAAPTARCHVLITDDGERTMQTFLGACVEIAVSDITPKTIGEPAVLLLEGYVWDTPEGPAAMDKATELAKQAGAKIALSLSDSFCVERHSEAFRALANGDADIIIGNEAEAKALFGTSSFDEVVRLAQANSRLFVITRSEKGSVAIHGDVRVDCPADDIEKLVDSTGAGDAYVAGFLFGLTQQQSLDACTALGTACASLAVTQIGARPQPAQLRALIAD